MYKIASETAQRQARKLWLADIIGPNWEELPNDKLRENLVWKWKSLTSKAASGKLSKDERAKLGLEIQKIQIEISALGRRKRGSPRVCAIFVDVVKERVPAGVFRMFMNEAKTRADAEEDAA